MAEFQLREIDAEIVQRVKALARERNCGANDVFLNLIRSALGILEPDAVLSTVHARQIEQVQQHLAEDEAAVLRAAMEALEQLPEDRSAFRMAGRDQADK